MTTESTAGSERITELDGLRGLAIFLVVLCHYIGGVPHGPSHSLGTMIGTVVGLGSSGVDLFFILSGFLIGGILIDSRESPKYYRTFYFRRFFRIFPVYYLWIALFALISIVSIQFHLQTPYWIYLAYLQNYSFQHSGMEIVWFGIMWSLGVEEQFYLLAPPLIRNVELRSLWRILLIVLAFSFFLRLYLSIRFGHATDDYWGLRAAALWMPCRADALALGVLMALAWRTEYARQWIASHLAYFRYTIVVCGFSILVALPWLVRPNSFFINTFGIPIFAGIFLSFLVIALADKKSIIAGASRWQGLRELGKISYCVYVIHVAVNWIVHRFVLDSVPRFDSWRSIAVTVLAFGVTLLIAELSWRFFEHPLVRRGHKYSYR